MIKHKILTLLVALCATTALLASNTITYSATKKLGGYIGALDIGKTTFGSAITSHDFSNGIGTITCDGEITTIGEVAFSSCSGLTSITIPNSVTTIGWYAFAYCDGLTSVTIPNSVTTIEGFAFYGCSGLTSITIPNSVTTIGDGAFSGCSGLTSITIPNSVTTIEGYAFSGCSGLTSITIPNSVTTIGDEAFSGCSGLTSITIPNSVTTIGDEAFWDCSGLTSITIPNSVTTIGDEAFHYCYGLTSIDVDAANTHYASVDGVLFNYAKDTLIQYPIGNSRTEYTIPNSVTTIGAYAFRNCSGLTSITIPNSVKTIGDEAFYGCSGLTSITCEATTPPSCGSGCFDEVKKSIPLYVLAGSVKVYKTANGWKSFTNIQPIIDETCIITYTATKKVIGCDGSLDVGKTTFGSPITSHNFSNGIGMITCAGEVKTIGDKAFYLCIGLTSVTIPNSVTTIGESAFRSCSGLTSINIPNSVTTIGSYAFYECSGLTSVTIPNSVTKIGKETFYKCSGLTSVTIGNSVKTIDDKAFYDCSGLTSITIPNSVTTIGDEAFHYCYGLKTVYNNSNLNITKGSEAHGYVAYYADKVYNGIPVGDFVIKQDTLLTEYLGKGGEVTIPNSVTTIGNSAFSGCSGLTSVTIPNSVTTIGESAFRSCSGLTSINIPNSVTTIGEYAFSGCSGLTSITIGNSVTTIGDWAFWGCSGLTSVTLNSNAICSKTDYDYHIGSIFGSQVKEYIIGNSVTTIGSYAFSGCSGLTSVTIDNSVTTIGELTFAHCSGLTSITIPNSVTTIGYWAFDDVNNIIYDGTATGSPWGAKCVNGYVDGYLVYSDATKTTLCGCSSAVIGAITIPNSVTTIGSSAFYKCSGLTSITIPNSVTTIGGGAFEGCSGLTSVTIGNSVTTIGDWAFWGCSGLTSVTIPNSVTTIGRYAFSGCSGLTSVTIPNSVTEIGEEAFYNCDGLKTVYNNSNLYITKGSTYNGYVAYYADKVYNGIPVGDFIIKQDTIVTAYIGSATDIVIPNSVTTIGDYAFRNCSGLTSVTIGNSVTTIGKEAFYQCFGLKTVYNNSNLYITKGSTGNGYVAYYADKVYNGVLIGDFIIKQDTTVTAYIGSATDIVIPNFVTTIGESAFRSCSGLTSVIIPNSVTTIGRQAFYGCSGLTSVTIGNSVTTIGNYAFDGCSGLAKTNYTGTIADWCKIKFSSSDYNPIYYSHNFFINDVEIKDLIIPEGVETIGSYAFYNCSGLTSVTIGNSVTEIGSCAFYGCSKLASVTLNSDAICSKTYTPYYGNIGDIFGSQVKEYIIGNSVTTIGDYAFYDCSGLTSVTIGNSVTTIGIAAFEYCDGLTSINVDASNTHFASIDGVLFNYAKDTLIQYPASNPRTEYTIPNSVTEIGDYAFEDCDDLTYVTIPHSVTTIGEHAFEYCSGLTSVTIPNSVTTIGERAFRGCDGLTSVTFLGKDCQNNIGDDAFYNVGKNAPATLFLPADWTGSKPVDSKTKWYGGYFTYTDTPTAIESIDDTQCTMHKFLRNGQVIIRQGNKTYNVIGQEVK